MGLLNIRSIKALAGFFLPSFAAICLVSVLVGGCEKKAGDLNVLLITIDGMRADAVGPKIKKAAEMPVLDSLWKEGAVFSNTIAASPQRTPSYSSIFSGLYPFRHGVRDSEASFLPDEIVTLPEVLRESGYVTGAVVGNVEVESKTGLSQGFDYYHDDLIAAPFDDGLPWGRRVPDAGAGDVTEKALGWLDGVRRGSKPWFLWIQYSDALPPREIPSPFREMFSSNSYEGALTYVDANIGLVVGKLGDWGIRDKTLIVITSPHGLTMAEHGESGVSSYNYISSIRVPAVLNLPGRIPSNRESPSIVSAVDLMPTILGIVDLEAPRGVDGRDLSEKILKKQGIENAPAYTRNMFLANRYNWYPVHSLVSNNYHIIRHKELELYDIQVDPGEENNLAASKTDKVEELNERLEEMISASSHATSRKDVASGVKEKLKLLGYAEDDQTHNFKMTNLGKRELGELRNEIVDAKKSRLSREYRDAVDKYTRILEKYPALALAKYELGLTYTEAGEYEKAKGLFSDAALSGSPPLKAASLVRLAEILSAENNLVEAENLLELAVEIVPKNPVVHTKLGNVYAAQGLDSEAEGEFRKALRLAPRFYRAHFALASLYITDPQRAPAALDELDKVFRYNPDFAPARVMAARILFRVFKNAEGAKKHLEKVLKNHSSGPTAERARQLLEEIENYAPESKR